MGTEKPLWRVGLTGGIGSGKTHVAQRFAALGVPILDADVIARELMAPGQPLLARLLARFGQDLCREDGTLDRACLRQRVFTDPRQRKDLEALLHPAIAQEMESRLTRLPQAAGYALLVIPLLVEAGWQTLVERILVVDCHPRVQVRRILARDGLTPAMAQAILEAQASRAQRMAVADDVLQNETPQGDDLPDALLQAAVRQLHARYQVLAAGPRRAS